MLKQVCLGQEDYVFHHVHRFANRAAHLLAKPGQHLSQDVCWWGISHPSVMSELQTDWSRLNTYKVVVSKKKVPQACTCHS